MDKSSSRQDSLYTYNNNTYFNKLAIGCSGIEYDIFTKQGR